MNNTNKKKNIDCNVVKVNEYGYENKKCQIPKKSCEVNVGDGYKMYGSLLNKENPNNLIFKSPEINCNNNDKYLFEGIKYLRTESSSSALKSNTIDKKAKEKENIKKNKIEIYEKQKKNTINPRNINNHQKMNNIDKYRYSNFYTKNYNNNYEESSTEGNSCKDRIPLDSYSSDCSNSNQGEYLSNPDSIIDNKITSICDKFTPIVNFENLTEFSDSVSSKSISIGKGMKKKINEDLIKDKNSFKNENDDVFNLSLPLMSTFEDLKNIEINEIKERIKYENSRKINKNDVTKNRKEINELELNSDNHTENSIIESDLKYRNSPKPSINNNRNTNYYSLHNLNIKKRNIKEKSEPQLTINTLEHKNQNKVSSNTYPKEVMEFEISSFEKMRENTLKELDVQQKKLDKLLNLKQNKLINDINIMFGIDENRNNNESNECLRK